MITETCVWCGSEDAPHERANAKWCDEHVHIASDVFNDNARDVYEHVQAVALPIPQDSSMLTGIVSGYLQISITTPTKNTVYRLRDGVWRDVGD